MLTEDFYDILDKEIEAILSRSKEDPNIARHKNTMQKKSFAFLIWFLEFYGQLAQYKHYITDGPGDGSCDIIFDKLNKQGQRIFYVVQAKWGNKKNALSGIKAHDVKYSLNDFETILRGDKSKNDNENFNRQYAALLEHLRKNGTARFIFLSLAQSAEDYVENISSFNKNNAPNVSAEVIDIERIKKDYIETQYKEIISANPLEPQPDAEYSKIKLSFLRFGGVPGKGDIIKKANTYTSYIVMVRPGMLFRLFDTYGFGLFYRNVRNPLHESNYNAQMARTLKSRPALFWYFNNGITAISKIIPDIGNEAEEVEITGLQIINGAQTAYTIYSVYKDASPVEREIMDKDAQVMLRLVDSSDEQFNLEITRFTNSQNPMFDRDFYANDDIQVRLQNQSFSSPYWYEKRRGEFRKTPPGITVVTNECFAAAYLAFHQEDISAAVFSHHLLFVPRKPGSPGLYETIFHDGVKFDDMSASFQVADKIYRSLLPASSSAASNGTKKHPSLQDERFLLSLMIAFLFKSFLKGYLESSFEASKKIQVTAFVLGHLSKDEFMEKLMAFSTGFILHSFGLVDKRGRLNIKAVKNKETFREILSRVLEQFRGEFKKVKGFAAIEATDYVPSLSNYAKVWAAWGDQKKATELFE